MSARPDANMDDVTVVSWTVTAASTTVEYQPVTLTAEKTCRLATAGEKVDGIAMESKTASQKVNVALLMGPGIIPIKVGTGGTALAKAKPALIAKFWPCSPTPPCSVSPSRPPVSATGMLM